MKTYRNKKRYSKMLNVLYKRTFTYCLKTWSLRAKAQKAGFCVLWSAWGFVLLSIGRKEGRKEGKKEGKKKGRKEEKWKRLETEIMIEFIK